jgi:hypothetical protein
MRTFLNGGGGTLMISVACTGRPKGPEDDLKTSRTTVTPFPLSTASEAAANRARRPASTGAAGQRAEDRFEDRLGAS